MTSSLNRFQVPKLRLIVLAAGLCLPLQGQAQDAAIGRNHIQLLDRYCSDCHNLDDFAGGLAFDLLDTSNVRADAETWEKVLLKLKAGMMPPQGQDQPSAREVAGFTESLAQTIDASWSSSPHTAAPMLHRMNRTEYQNAIRDLLDLPFDAASLFPADAASDGFDNIADVLSVSPALMEAYISVASKISRLAVGDMTTSLSTSTYRADGQDQSRHLEGHTLGTRGGVSFQHVFPLDAEYEFRITGDGGNPSFVMTPVGTKDPIELVIDGERVALFPPGVPARVVLSMPAGPHVIEAAFVKSQSPVGVNDLHHVWSESILVSSVAIAGPMNPSGSGDTPSRRKIFTCSPASVNEEEACARQILEQLAHRAYRRPVTEKALATLLNFYRDGREQRDFDTGVQYALARILVDPQFIFRFEEEPEGMLPGAEYPLGSYELASRLSFFIWSSIPDDALLAAAASDALQDRAVLEQQIARMLQDPKAEALVTNFAASWLALGQLNNVNPTAEDFDGSLRTAMRRETELLLESVILENKPVSELLTADYTFVNERLAEHYGIPNIRGSHFRKVSLAGTGRQGLLGHGSILTITSAPNRTSPVIRGRWIMENLLGTPPPPPPPGVETNLEPEPGIAETTLRDRLERHRADPSCAACHAMMDPIGFALENFDPVGKFRLESNGFKLDTSAMFWDGTHFEGPAGLYDIVAGRSELFVENLAEKLLTYALGRKVEYYDMPQVRAVLSGAAKDEFRFSALVREIALSAAFTRRTKEGEDMETAQR